MLNSPQGAAPEAAGSLLNSPASLWSLVPLPRLALAAPEGYVDSYTTMSEFDARIPSDAVTVFFFLDSADFRIVRIDASCRRLLGVPGALLVRHPTAAVALIHPVDRRRFIDRLRDARHGVEVHDMFRLERGPDWNRVAVRLTRLDSGNGLIVGVLCDATYRHDELSERGLRRDREVQVAARIQRNLLCDTTPVHDHGFSVVGATIPSESVDGDFYAHFSCFDGSIDIALGDVMGKGVEAALLAAATRLGILRATAQLLRFGVEPNRPPEPADIIRQAHSMVFGELYRLNCFVTLAYARFDSGDYRLSFVDAGNPPIILHRVASGRVWYLKGRNVPFGFQRDAEPVQLDLPLEEGDLVLFHSDGLTEAIDDRGEQFGEKRIADYVASREEAETDSIVSGLVRTVRDYAASEGFSDDVSTIAVRFERRPGSSIAGSPAVKRRVTRLIAGDDFVHSVRAFLEIGMAGGPAECASENMRASFVSAVSAVVSLFSGGTEVLDLMLSVFEHWASAETAGDVTDYERIERELSTVIGRYPDCSIALCSSSGCSSSGVRAMVVVSIRYTGF